MFSGIWAKIVAGLTAIIGVMAVILKFKNNKIENLERDNKAHEKKEEIREDVEKGEDKLEKQAEEKLEDVQKNDSNWRDNI